jgi:WD40 repeat protein
VLDIGFAMLDGQIIVASCGLDGALKLWDTASMHSAGEPLIEHPEWIRRVTAKKRSRTGLPQKYFPVAISGIVADRYVTLRGDGDMITASAYLIGGRSKTTQFALDMSGEDWFCSCIAHGDALNGQIVAAAFDGRIRIWDLERRVAAGTDMRMDGDLARVIVVRHDGDRILLAAGGVEGWLYLWNLGTRTIVHKFHTTSAAGPIGALDLKRLNGRLFVAAGFDNGSISLWDGDSGWQIGRQLLGHEGRITAMALTVINGRSTIISGGDGGSVRRWDITGDTGEHVASPMQRVIPGTVLSMTTAATDCSQVAAGTDLGTIHLLDIDSGVISDDFQLSDGVDAIAIGQLQGRAVVAGGRYGGVIQAWDLTTRKPYPPLLEQSPKWGLLDISQVGKRLLVASVDEDNRFRLRDIETSRQIGTPILLPKGGIEKVVLTALNGDPVGVIQFKNSRMGIHAYDMRSGRLHRKFRPGTPLPSTMGVNIVNNTPIVVYLCSDFFIRAWDISSGKLVGHSSTIYDDDAISPIVVGKLGEHIIVVAFDVADQGSIIRMWRLSDWYEFFTLSLPFNNYAISIQDPFICIGGEKGILSLQVNPSI